MTFKGNAITLDGNEYFGCKFDGCQLIFCGTQGVTLENCNFGTNAWVFDGPAARTLAFMTAMHSGGAQSLIEATFENIRGNATARGVKLN